MKTYLIFLALLVLVGYLGWGLHLAKQENIRLQTELNRMNEHALALEKDILALNQEIRSLEGRTVEGAVGEANEALIKGWEAFINRVQKELGKVQEELEEEMDEQDNNSGKMTDPGSPIESTWQEKQMTRKTHNIAAMAGGDR